VHVGLDEINDAGGNFQKKLKMAVSEIEIESMETMHMTKLIESNMASIG
jgi:hypothetical protein